MADTNLPAPAPFINVCGLKYVEQDGKILFSTKEIGYQLGYKNPYKAVNNLFNRNFKELQSFSVILKLRTTDGKEYEMRHFTEEGVYIISMLANTPTAQNFRALLARLLRQIREQRVELARAEGYARGRAEAVALPALQAERKLGYLDGIREGKRLAQRNDRLRALEKMAAYVAKGLTYREIGKLLGISFSTVGKRIARARKLGFWPQQMPPAPVQGSLLTDGVASGSELIAEAGR